MTETVSITVRCAKCKTVVRENIPVFNMKLENAMAIARQMERPGVVILCDDCTPKEATT